MNLFGNRYGMDKLNRVLLWGALIINLVSVAVSLIFGQGAGLAVRIMQGVSLVMAAFMLIRALSRNYVRRQNELAAYMRFESRIKQLFARARSGGSRVINIDERRRYKHLTCPQCMQKLRVPRGKGKILVTCSKCHHKFQTKT